jgi:hypothetical protein
MLLQSTLFYLVTETKPYTYVFRKVSLRRIILKLQKKNFIKTFVLQILIKLRKN